MHRIRLIVILFFMMLFFAACGSRAKVYVGSAAEEAENGTDESADDSDGSLGEGKTTASESTAVASETAPKEIACYVCGAVKNQGVYYLTEDKRKKDAVDAAGGFTGDAAQSYVNLAEKVHDGEKIYIPTEDELEAGLPAEDEQAGTVTASGNGYVDINSADKEELMTLPGIGGSKADSIIVYREAHGGFKSPEEILEVQGIKEGIYNKIKDKIVVY